MVRSRLNRMVLTAVALVAVMNLAAGCSSSDSKSSKTNYCESWQKVATSFEKLNDIAITTDGIKGLDTAVEEISGSITQLVSSADSMLKPKVEALQDAINSFADTLSSPEISTNYLTTLQSELEGVDKAWNDLVDAAKTKCPDVKASAV